MSGILFPTALVALAAGILQSPVVPPDQFEFVRYVVPDGWTARNVQEGASFVRGDGSGVVVFYASRSEAGSEQDVFASTWHTHVEPAVGASAPELRLRREGAFVIAVGAQQIVGQNGTVTAALITVSREGRTLPIVGVARGEVALRELTRFLDSVRPTSAAAAGPSTPIVPNAGRQNGEPRPAAGVPIEPGRVVNALPSGLFYRVEVDIAGGRGIETNTWLFMPGQRVSRFHPLGGSGVFDPSRCNPDTCGTYEISSGKLTVRWDGGSTQEWTFTATADGVRLDGQQYRPVRAVRAESLAGRWTDARSGDIGVNTYTFDRGGRFSFGDGRSALTGSYRVRGLVLTLTFSDGDVRERMLFSASTEQPEGLISIDRAVYARR
ncbi:MAG: hypothetical protein R3E10_13210 [Gemmatimonadota bacterium]